MLQEQLAEGEHLQEQSSNLASAQVVAQKAISLVIHSFIDFH